MAKKDESKASKGKEEGKGNKKGGKKPSVSDVKEANRAVLEFPADAKTPGIEVFPIDRENAEVFPIDRVGEDTPPAASGEATPPATSAEEGQLGCPVPPVTGTPEIPDPIDENPLNPGVFGSPIIISETQPVVTDNVNVPVITEPVVTEPVAAIEPIVEPTVELPSPPPNIPIEEENNQPTQEELEEKVIEKWYNSQNKPSEVNHFELANSAAGINMTKFSAYEAIVGKFKFKRSHAGANWQITVDESK